MNEIKRLWVEFDARPFPPELTGAEEIDGINLASLDTFAAGCIDTFLERKACLDAQRTLVLEQCVRELAIIERNVTGDAKAYFVELRILSEKVLRSLG
jgi:hypothetical protein